MNVVERLKNVTTVELKEGNVHLVFGGHHDPQKLPQEHEGLMQTTDALVLEFVTRLEDAENYLNSPVDVLESILHSPQYSELFLARWKTGKPFYILDAFLELESESELNDFLRVAEPVIGSAGLGAVSVAFLLKKWRQRKQKKESLEKTRSVSRRNLLMGLAAIGFGAWSLTPPLASHAQNISYKTGGGFTEASDFQKFAQKIHPELDKMTVKYRNLLMAYKLIKLLQHEKVPDATMVVGLAHVGIEDILVDYQQGNITLQDMEAALKEINASIHSPVFDTVGKYRYDAAQEKWKIESFEIPELK